MKGKIKDAKIRKQMYDNTKKDDFEPIKTYRVSDRLFYML